MKKKVLFVCVHNSARSQMAEALLNQMCGDLFEAASAGLQPGTLNPLAVAALREIGIDIRAKETRGVDEVIKSGQTFDYVITVCDESSAEQCPVFPGGAQCLHWNFPDPAKFTGTQEEKLEQTRKVRDAIEAKLVEFCPSSCRAVA
ncbi:MAG TPA: arsenate reductase ArsC [Candidatus Binatia bacterium]|jgi:arsenate reductase